METRAEKDAKTLLIVRTLGLLVLVVVGSLLGVWLVGLTGLEVPETAARVVVAALVLVVALLMLRRRH